MPCLLGFDLGMKVSLNGLVEVSSSSGDLSLLVPSDPSKSVRNPFGMTGVSLSGFGGRGSLSGAGALDIALQSAVTFSQLPGVNLEGALVLQNSSPRMAGVYLSAQPPLTLAQLVTAVTGSGWPFGSDTANWFALSSGMLYYLTPGPPYTYRTSGWSIECTPGYHAQCVLRMFGAYDFSMHLDVEKAVSGSSAVTLHAISPTPIGNEFITFTNPTLELSTNPQSLSVSTDIKVWGTTLPSVSAGYDSAQQAFVGSVTAPLGDVTLGVHFAWDSKGVRITRIDGLPGTKQDLAKQFAEALNSTGGKCEEVVADWLNGLTQTTLSPTLDGMPTSVGDGKMRVPLSLEYSLKVKVTGTQVARATIPLPVTCGIPSSLEELPGVLVTAIVDSLPEIVEAMLQDEDTFQAVAVEVATRGVARAAASFMCRAQEKGWDAVAEAVEAAAAQPTTLAGALELTAQEAALTLALLGTAAGGLLAGLDQLVNRLEGSNGAERTEAEQQLQDQCDKIQSSLDATLASIQAVRDQLALKALTVGVAPGNDPKADPDGDYTAAWSFAAFGPPDLGTGAAVSVTLTLLAGAPGSPGDPWGDISPVTLSGDDTFWKTPLSSIPNLDQFGMNASIVATATGLALPADQIGQDLRNAIDKLSPVQDEVAQKAVAQLQAQLTALTAAQNAGYTSDTVYATLPNTATFAPAGGNGTPFDDLPRALLYGPLTGIVVQHGDVVDGIQAVYGDHTLAHHGGYGGRSDPIPPKDHPISFKDDPITFVGVVYGFWDQARKTTPVVLSLVFKSRSGKQYGPYGTYVWGGSPPDPALPPDPPVPDPPLLRKTIVWKAAEGQSLLALSGSTGKDPGPEGAPTLLFSLGVTMADDPAVPPPGGA